MQAHRKDFSVPEFNGQFDKLTDRTETRSLSLPKGAQRMRGPFFAFNILGFPAFAENDGRWFLSPEGAKCDSPG